MVVVVPVLAVESIHIVRTGDTLFSLARRHGTTILAIMQANGLTDPNLIYVGQRLVIPAGSSAPPATPGAPASGETIYTVRTGDTLSALSRRFGVSMMTIAQMNGIVNPSLIYIGQKLVIPGGTVPPTTTPTPTAVPEPEATPEPDGGFYYTVKTGDTLLSIATRYGTTLSLLVAANNMTNPNWIVAGQQLWIPSASAPAPPATPPPTPVSSSGFGYGIQVHLPGQDRGQVLDAVNDLGFSWVKQQIEWKVYEPARGQIQWGGAGCHG
jgi:LysM repeat protein